MQSNDNAGRWMKIGAATVLIALATAAWAASATGTSSNDDKVFTPTEEISEDYAVAFPVDI